MTVNLRELQKRFQSRSVLALTLEASRIAVSLVRQDNGGSRMLRLLSVCIGAEDIVRKPEKAGAEFAAALEEAGIRERRCVVCVPPTWALAASADLPEVGAEDLRGYFELRAESEFSVPISDLRLAHCPYVLPGGKRRATIAAVQARQMEAVEKMLQAAGCRAVSVSLRLDGCFREGPPTLHILSNGDCVDLVVSTGGGIAALRSLALADSNGEVLPVPTAFSREIRVTLGRLPDALGAQVKAARFGKEELRLKLGGELQRLGITSAENETDSGVESPEAAIDAAARYLGNEPVAFEFVVREVSPWPATLQRLNTKRGRQIAGSVFGAVALLMLVFVVRSKIESGLESDWKGMQNTVADLDSLQQKIRKFRPWFEPAPQGLQIVESLMTAFPDKGDVWAKSVQIGQGYKVSCSAFARNSAAMMGLQDRLRGQPGVRELKLQQMRGENPLQFSVTYQWEAKHDK